MALSRNDELNNLRTQADNDKIEQYFEEMDLPIEEINERIALAKDLDDLWLRIFLLIMATKRLSEEIDIENLKDLVRRNYSDILTAHGYDADDSYYSRYVEEIDGAVLTTTEENMAYDYYLSGDRAIEISVNDTNALANYRKEIEAIKAGKTMKRWVTMRDNRVRKTHIAVDGNEVPIQLPFHVGDGEMLFPLDQSLGAHAKECINCRCTVEYFGEETLTNVNNDDIVNTRSRNFIESVLEDYSYVSHFSVKEIYEILKAEGYDVSPLGKGRYKGIDFLNGGGYRIHYGGNGIFQYHPDGKRHNGGKEYYKISNSEIGVVRMDTNGRIIEN